MPVVKSAPTRVDAVVFDCDGLLVETESRWTVAETSLFAEHGLAFGQEQKAMLIGRSIEAAAEDMAACFGRPGEGAAVGAELLVRVHREIEALAEPQPGAIDLVRACAERVPVAVASNSPRSLLDIALQGSGLADLLPVSVAGDEVERPKPDPDLYLEACRLLGAAPTSSVAFEDSGTGVASARAAGLYVIAIPSLPGMQLDHDWELATLTDPELLAWASALGPRDAQVEEPSGRAG
jgi:HAD superfamily hydrolase (TIGR01509 family)